MDKKAGALAVSSMVLFLVSCSMYKDMNRLDPGSRDFYSKVKYIITKQEKKAFLGLPAEQRKAFIEEFWKKRDPKPETEVNEFKEEYYKRIEEANFLFKEGTSPGWLQARGELYILLGPPDNRETYPRGYTFYGYPMEIWYYNFFPVVFIDQYWNGNYRLDPLSAQQAAVLLQATVQGIPSVPSGPPERVVALDFKLKVDKTGGRSVVFHASLPYRDIWFTPKDGELETELALTLEVTDGSGTKVWDFHKAYSITLDRKKLAEYVGKDYAMEVPADFGPGRYSVSAQLESRQENRRVKKQVDFSL